MSQPPRQIPIELVEQIIDIMSDDRTLQSCSFVAKSWRPRALMHIFRSFALCGSLPWLLSTAPPRNVYNPNRFARLLDKDPHLAVYIREIEIHAESMTRDEFQHVLSTLVDRQSSLPLDWEVQRLVVRGSKVLDGPTLALAGDALSGAFPSLRTLQLEGWFVESHNLIEFAASFPALAELTLKPVNTPMALHRLHGRAPTPVASTCRLPHLRSLLVEPVGMCMSLCQLPTILSELRQRAPKMEHVELRVSLPRHGRLFTSLPVQLDGWIKRLDIRLDRGLAPASHFSAVTQCCSRAEELFLTWEVSFGMTPKSCSFPLSAGFAGNSFAADLVALRVLHITLDVRDIGLLASIPAFRDWEKLEDDLVRNSHFTQLWLHVTVDYIRESSARRTLTGLLPRLRAAQKVYTRYTVIPKLDMPMPRMHGSPRTINGLLQRARSQASGLEPAS